MLPYTWSATFNIYIYIMKLWITALWDYLFSALIRTTTTTTTMLLPCTWSTTCNMHNETMVWFMRLCIFLLWTDLQLLSLLCIQEFYDNETMDRFMRFSIFCLFKYCGLVSNFFFCCLGLINYASDINAPQKRVA